MKKVRNWLWFALTFALIMWAMSAFAQFQFPPIPQAKQIADEVTLYGKVDEERATQVVSDIQEANRLPSTNPIRLYINSGGGSVLAGNRIVQAIEASRRPVDTICVGMAASMSGLVYSYGAHRYQLPRTIVMLHDGYFSTEGSADKSYSVVALYERLDADFDSHIASITGMTVAEVHARNAVDWWMLPGDAIANHLTDKVITLPYYPAH
jgi:ATP-dependent Clp protease protease subunit